MRQLAKYSFVNAKVRAMLSYLLSPALFSRLLEAKDFYGLIETLRDTPYKGIADKAPTDINIEGMRFLEKELIKKDLYAYRKVYNAISTKPEKKFVSLLMERYELEQLKVALRIWHKKIPIDIHDYLLGEKISFDIDYSKIINSQHIEEIILLLDHTPYKEPLLNTRNKFKERKSSFYLEVSLDLDYYKRLMGCIEGFSGLDRGIAKKILGIEIDIENINWLIRLRKYYGVGVGEILEWVIPGGDKIAKNNIISLYSTNGLAKIVESVSLGPYLKIKDLIEENVNLIESFLYGILLGEIKKALSGFPFTIGGVLGYLILKHRETKHIVSLMYAKYYGLGKEEALSLLNINQ